MKFDCMKQLSKCRQIHPLQQKDQLPFIILRSPPTPFGQVHHHHRHHRPQRYLHELNLSEGRDTKRTRHSLFHEVVYKPFLKVLFFRHIASLVAQRRCGACFHFGAVCRRLPERTNKRPSLATSQACNQRTVHQHQSHRRKLPSRRVASFAFCFFFVGRQVPSAINTDCLLGKRWDACSSDIGLPDGNPASARERKPSR